MSEFSYPLKKMFSDLRRDLERYNRYCGYQKTTLLNNVVTLVKCPVFLSIVNYRFGFWANTQSGVLRICCYALYNVGMYLSIILFKVHIENCSEIGSGLFLSQRGNIIIGVKMMGRNCSVFNETTIGQGVDKDGNSLPEIGDNVCIDSGSVIFGSIKIGEGAKVNAFTVLSRSLPVRSTVEGNPARLLKKKVA